MVVIIIWYAVYIIIGIPPVENLTVADQCTTIRANWSITEGSCTDLSYNVTLLSSDGVILQGPFTTSDTVYDFTNVTRFNGPFNVRVVLLIVMQEGLIL